MSGWKSTRWTRANALRAIIAFAAFLMIGLTFMDVRRAGERANSLYQVGILGLSVAGDLQYQTQESRRPHLYALTTTDPNKQLPSIDRSREAGLQVDRLLQSASVLDLDLDSRRQLSEFAAAWRSYLTVRDEIISLILEERFDEARSLEEGEGVEHFDRCSLTLHRLKEHVDSFSAERSASLRTTLYRAGVELTLLIGGTFLFIVALAKANSARKNALAELRESHRIVSRSEVMERQRALVLERVGRNAALDDVLDAVINLAEGEIDNAICAVSVLSDERLYIVSAPRLPVDFQTAIRNLTPGAAAASSGAAVFWDKPVFVRDIETDPLWEDLKELAFQHRLHFCWSLPIKSSLGSVLGSLTLYGDAVRSPNPQELFLLKNACQLSALAIENRQIHDQLAFQAHHDSLTQLPNRLLFHDRLVQGMANSARDRTGGAVMWVDLDGFKHVNDLLGHRVGDALLCQVARNLQRCVRSNDSVARIGGDEFAILLNGIADDDAAVAVASKILAAFQTPITVSDHEVAVTASIGIARFRGDTQDATVLLRCADSAMYHAKKLGKNTFQFFFPELTAALDERLNIEKYLKNALANGEFEVYYQPQVEIGGELIGMEALLRWNCPELDSIGPATFIPIAEEIGLIIPIGSWVLRTACLQAVAWQRAGMRPFKLAVNVSSQQFARPDFVRLARTLLEETGLEGRYLELELTESAVMRNLDSAAQSMDQLRKLGISIAIDDFGTGYSSLSYLQRLPANVLKIDKSFTNGIAAASQNSLSIIRGIVALAHSLELHVVAEGVETEGQLQKLGMLGCDSIQGFLVQKPIPASQVSEWIGSWRSGSAGGSQSDLLNLCLAAPSMDSPMECAPADHAELSAS